MEMINVQQAEDIILSQYQDYGKESIAYQLALGRVLAEDILADRDLPPFDRPTVDGIAIRFTSYEKGNRTFAIKAVQSAGEASVAIDSKDQCIEIMTGAALDSTVDTVIRYEDITVSNGIATINIDIRKGQNIHLKGKDKSAGEVLVKANQVITPAIIGIAASVGKTSLQVKKIPKIIIISTGDEMITPELVPEAFQLRRSNGITIQSVLEKYKIAADLLHLNDNYNEIKNELIRCIAQYDVLLMSGGVSMGKFDYLPQVCEEVGIEKLFHKIKQRPGKPFWFGKSRNQKLAFAFPGNPVSVFMCLHRYFIPWLEKSLGIPQNSPLYAILGNDIEFPFSLQYFAQVKLQINEQGQLIANIVDTNGSGDFSHLAETDAFVELPLEQNIFRKGEVYKIWKYSFLNL
ncbi:molybdopterin molybdenumtransferase MoeA [Elizabethkingia anophelis]|uniref:molybdopterin molybdotransferase MoeA n=2 Tax=Elizabethkingia anophelis TaxID=1117645 RepID=UPI000CE93D00|nr:molybdopterin molybdotransferase MoeA [Elizabethkingia anophelis]AVF49037.1 molybdopterin molybdenumtransferase MoeA [Elizabethkingia anophelis]AVF53033.1 molybdopterin molybdenumtransferase MoeA [Elizabethkingia anophelis]MBG0506710.1 molybdopterin molybdotransferase MoeA [Elizabethkingia anophelis]MCT4073476.1 molybdopterin molybdotransferase MoeA [Elizabethkingia anophelis]MDV3900418.1 molybdopterin molybdenumtransferase MoeA [Elizabethkingia anophelis]